MPLKNILRRRLLSLLQPWLREEPDLDISLGFFHSLLVANNLSFDVSALNQLFDDPACLFFKNVTVERLSVRFSSWDTPAFTFEVQGVHLVLSLEKPGGEEYTKLSRRSKYDYSENLTKKLSVLDPEGCDLHHLLERILFAVPSRKAFTTSILNLILKHCHFKAYNIHLKIQFPVLNDMFMCFGEMKEFSAKSRYLDRRCLLCGFVSVIFRPLRESSYMFYGIGFKVGFNSNDQTDRVLLSSDLCSFMNLRNLKLAGCSLCFPELAFSFSPDDIAMYLAFSKMLSSKSNCARSARELWRVAASRIGHVTVTSRSSLRLLVGTIGQWIRYVNAYEDLLLVIGYSTDLLLGRSNSKTSNNKMGLVSARHHWEVISDLEKKLPVEAIALARRIARHKAALKIKSGDYEQCYTSSPFKFFYHFLHILALLWSVILKIIQFVAYILFLGNRLVQDPEIDGCLESHTKDPCQRCCFVLNFGKIVVMVSQINEIQPSIYEKLQSLSGTSYSNFHSVCLSVDALLLVSIEDNFRQKQLLSCGQMKVKISPLTMTPETSAKNFLDSLDGNRRGGINDMEPFLWVDPAKAFVLSDSTSGTEEFSNSYLENFLGKIYLSCKGICSTFDESEIEYSDNPCLLCKVERSFIYPGSLNPDFGFYECGLMLGKINIALTHSSVSSLSVLLSQLQHTILWEHKEKSSVASGSSDKPEISWVNKYKLYAQQLIRTSLGMLPEKQIRFGAFVDGPFVRFLKEANNSGHDIRDIVSQDGFELTFDFGDIEVAARAPFDAMAPFTDQLGFDNTGAEYYMLEPQAIEIPKPNNEKYASWGNISFGSYLHLNGLNASLERLTEEHQIQLFVSNPITVQLSSFREYVYSLSATIVASSASLGIMARGCTVLLFLDELYMIYEAVASLSSAVSYLFRSFESSDCIASKIMKQELLMEPEIGKATVRGNQWTNSERPFLLNGICQLESVDVILHTSRRINDVESCMRTFELLTGNKLAEQKLPDCGIWNSIQKTTIVISCGEEKMDLLIDLSRVTSLVFKYQNYIGKDTNHIVLESLLLQSVHCLHEITLSDCICTICLGSSQNANASSSGFEGKIHGRLNDQFNSLVKKIGSRTNMLAPASATYWFLINVAVGNAFIGKCSLKNDLVRAHEPNELLSLLSVGGELLTISWEIQGGHIILETTTLAVAIDCYSSYSNSIGSLTAAAKQHNKHITKAEHDEVNENYIDDNVQHTICISQRDERRLPDAFSLSLSRSALVVVLENESGGLQELVLEVDIHLKFALATAGRKLVLDLSHLSILSQYLQKNVEDETEIPHFTSVKLKDSSSHIVSGDASSKVRSLENFLSIDDASSSRNPVPLKKDSEYRCGSDVFHLSHQNNILKDLRALMSLERPENGSLHLSRCWFGSCSLSGFEITLSVSEIQTILSMVTSLSGAFSQKTTPELGSSHGSSRQEFENTFEAMVPDGAIVAIQDVSQHMYFTVEDGERNFSVGGTIHYSLVGERALFKVKHCIQKRWSSTVMWFSLISLYAKNGKGESLRLNYSPGSCFVDISCTNDGGSALWRVHPYEDGRFRGVTDWDACNQLVKRTFYLVNKRNDSAIAFVDDVPEFVRKPGNPFKFKVFHDFSVSRNVTELSRYHGRASHASLQMDQERISWKDLPHVDIKIEKISLNIVHELSETEDFVPLIRGCINNTQLIIQSLETKSRVISTSTAVVHYFDTQRNSWGELLYPVEIYIFCRSNIQTQHSEYSSHAVPVKFYCKTKELNISLSEPSLDMLLFMIGKLNLSGPYSLRSSLILANCCKVVNQSGLNLLFHFNQQRIAVARKQFSAISLRRHSGFMTQDSGVATHASIQLADAGSFTTSSIHLSLAEGQSFAWRTRIMSIEGSETYPGPFLVVTISTKIEDCLSVEVSPLIRIHNETGFPMELQFQRSEAKGEEFASVLLKSGDSIDDSMAMFDAIKFSGGVKRALMSLSVGNFLLSFRPEMTEDLVNSRSILSVDWSDHIKGGKAIHLSGIFDKLNYRIRKALFIKSVRCSFSTACCILKSDGAFVGSMHFLIQTISRDVPVSSPGKSNENSPVSLQDQKEIYILPTVQVTNLLHSEINVLLSETDQSNATGYDHFGKQATISCGSTVDFYANPTVIYFTVTLATFNWSSKPVNSSDCVKKLLKRNNEVQHLDIDLDFDGGKFLATLRLYRGNRGMLEAVVFTSYSLKNDTDFPVYVLATRRRPLSRIELDNLDSSIPLELGLCLPPKSTRSWFFKSKKVQLKLMEDHTSEAVLDLDALSGLTEISFDNEEGSGVKSIIKLGVSTGPSSEEIVVPSQAVTLVPRYVICNESEGCITVRQCYLQDDMAGTISIESKQRATIQLKEGYNKKREFNLFENFIRKHRSSNNNSLLYVQFQTHEPGLGWSGPVCIASLGRFFVKFRKLVNPVVIPDSNITQFAVVHVVEERSTLVLHFHKPPNMSLPYRIENCLHDLSITYYQKGLIQPEVLGSSCCTDYVWDDLTLPHKLVVRINDSLQLREIKLDKVGSWKPFYKVGQQRVLAPRLLPDKRSGDQRSFPELNGMEMAKVGYEIYADGPTRVLRICEISDSFKRDKVLKLLAKVQLRVSQLAVHLLEQAKQEGDGNEPTDFTPFTVARFGNLSLITVSDNNQKYYQFNAQYLNFELKWNGAPYASMLRRHQLDYIDTNDSVLNVAFVLLASSSNVKQVRYSSIFLQPIDLNLDEETLMKIASFWRTSLSNSESQLFYFDHFEIHPIKITANFIPGESHSNYSSAQETVRSLLHSVVKVPPVKNMVVELNGVLITHALITVRELCIKCAQHYSWYAMRAIYIAKGSPLLPPDFVSIFDDSASSSLDVFFDPSRGLMSLPGFTLGTFKLISKCIKGEGFSGTKRYFGDLGKTLRSAGSNVAFSAVTEVSDSVLKGAEANGFKGMVNGFHQGILKLAMEPSFLGTALMEGSPDRKITLDRSPGVDELYIEGYIQAMLDTVYRQEYLRVRVVDNQVILKNLPPNHSLISEITDRVKEFLVSKALLKGDPSKTSRPLRHLRGESEWKIGPTLLTLCEHLLVSFAIRVLRRKTNKFVFSIKSKRQSEVGDHAVDSTKSSPAVEKVQFIWKWGIGKFVLSGILAYIDGRLCRCIPNPVARRVVSGFLLSYIDQKEDE